MSRRRPTRAELADHYALDWLAEREAAETQPCPPAPRGCGVPAGRTCRSPLGRPLLGPPAHPARIHAAARAAAAARRRPRPPSPTRDRSNAA